MISLDGGHGGGQMLRTALALSSLTGKPFRMTNIRANRPNPGLKAQHLSCVRALVDWTGAKAEGDQLGSKELMFMPGELKSKTVIIDIRTAGSITLMMQSLLLPALFANGPVRFSIRGGTDVPWSMSWDYFVNVLLPHYRSLGSIEASLIRRGYYPRGGGEVRIRVVPKFNGLSQAELEGNPIRLGQQGILHAVRGVSHASEELSLKNVAERQARACHHMLIKLGVPVQIDSNYQVTDSLGSGVAVWALFSDRPDDIDIEHPTLLGADALGKRDVSADAVGEQAGAELMREFSNGSAADTHLVDNLVPLLALRGGEIRSEAISSHVRTNMEVVSAFLGTSFLEQEGLLSRKD